LKLINSKKKKKAKSNYLEIVAECILIRAG